MSDKMTLRIMMLVWSIMMSVSSFGDDQGKIWLKMGDEQYEKGYFDVAFEYYQKAAELNVTEAQFKLGYAYYYGEGIKKDYPSAAKWFKRAANSHYPKAENALAYCYLKGDGVPCDYDKALHWLLSAANNGLVEAQETLSDCYWRGVLVEQDSAESVRWKEMAEGKSSHPVNEIKMEDRQKQVETKTTENHVQKAPVVKILYPRNNSSFHTNSVCIRYQLLANGLEDSTEVIALVDTEKSESGTCRSVKQANSIDVEVPNRDCIITLYAKNRAGNSEPVSIRLIRENQGQEDLPRLICAVIGVGDYHDEKLPPLKLSTKDARDFANIVQKKEGHPFSDVPIMLLTDKEANREGFFEAMRWLKQEAHPNDLCFFYYAGHGYKDEKDRFYFIPYGETTDKLYNCFSASDFKNQAEDINCKLIVFVDACFSGALYENNRSVSASNFVEQLRRTKKGTLLYASSSSDTKSKEDPSWGNGAFTKALISAFDGGARKHSEEGLSTVELYNYLYDEVRRITDYKQTPVFYQNGMEPFIIFLYED